MRHGFCYQMELNFDSEDAKQALLTRIESAKCRLAPILTLWTIVSSLLHSLLDKVEVIPPNTQANCLEDTRDKLHNQTVPASSMLDNSGMLVSYHNLSCSWEGVYRILCYW